MNGLVVDRRRVGTHVVGTARTTRATGDLRIDGEPAALAERRRAIAEALLPGTPGPAEQQWVWLRQVHGADVVTVTGPEGVHAASGSEADALVTAAPGVLLAVHTADCAPVTFVDPAGVVAIAHAGWRGLAAGVLEATVAAMRALGAVAPSATLGPCIHAECYAFGAADLDAVVAAAGEEVRGVTATGAPALDLVAGVTAVLDRCAVPLDAVGDCTACAAEDHYSHRARAEVGRMAHLVWIEP